MQSRGQSFFFLRNQLETSPSNAEGADLIPGWGAKISHASWPNKLIKQKQYCNKFNKDFKNGLHQKKKKIKKNLVETRCHTCSSSRERPEQ